LRWPGKRVLVLFMSGIAAPHTLADRFAWLIDGLCRVIGNDAYRRRVDAVLVLEIWNRIRRLSERFLTVVARVQSGRLPRRRKEKHPHPDRSALRSDPPRERERGKRAVVAAEGSAVRLPRDFGWIRSLLPETAQYAGVLAYLLRDPEMAALLEKAPEAGRMLRPLCHLLGVRPPEILRRGGVAAQEAVAPTAAAEVGRAEPGPPSTGREPLASLPLPNDIPADTQAVEITPAAQPPPQSGAAQAEEAARRYAQRPGGLYWDGTRFRWS
jgi:hypothetical protein